ncbi:MAG: ATP-binding protein [Candidatus Binatia bacterium]
MRTAYVANTTVSFEEMLRLVLSDFGAPTEHRERVDLLLALNALLLRCAEEGTTALLIIDEAHNLDAATLENIRLLSNVETFATSCCRSSSPASSVPMLRRSSRRCASRERVAVHCRLMPLGRFESRAYLDYRLLKAGGSSSSSSPATRATCCSTPPPASRAASTSSVTTRCSSPSGRGMVAQVGARRRRVGDQGARGAAADAGGPPGAPSPAAWSAAPPRPPRRR